MALAVSPKTVLLVEDDDGIRQCLQELLNYEGYQVRSVENGLQALEVLKTLHPSVILLDLMMPVMDGYGFLEEVKKRRPEGAESVPILVLTAAGDRAAKVQDAVAGVIRKPIEMGQLLAELERFEQTRNSTH